MVWPSLGLRTSFILSAPCFISEEEVPSSEGIRHQVNLVTNQASGSNGPTPLWLLDQPNIPNHHSGRHFFVASSCCWSGFSLLRLSLSDVSVVTPCWVQKSFS